MSDATAAQEVASYYTNVSFYPWQDKNWDKLFCRNLKTDHFPHAILLNGQAGIGKKDLAFYLAKALLCQSPTTNPISQQVEACHHCRACQLFSIANHPDCFHLTIAEDKKVITVDSVRELIQWSVLNSQFNGKKVIIIEPAEAMNQNAANSLLKTLEEPVADTIIILLSDNKYALLPTIISRCQAVDLTLPEHSTALHWLQQQLMTLNADLEQAALMLSLANGAPLLALDFFKNNQFDVRKLIIDSLLSIHQEKVDPVQVADELSKSTKVKPKSKLKSKSKTLAITSYDVIYWLDAIVIDIVRLSQYEPQNKAENRINNIDYLKVLTTLSDSLNLIKLLHLSEQLQQSYHDIQSSININLLFAQLLIDWKNCKG